MIFFRLLARMPWRFLYLLSDFLYVLVFHIAGYRKQVVMNNLQNAFPEKSLDELYQIRRLFYQHLCDFVVETLKVLALHPAQLRKRVSITNLDILQERLKDNSVIVLTGHYGHWEWLLLTCSLYLDKVDAVYKPLSSSFFDKFMLEVRTKFGAVGVPMQTVLREILKIKEEAHTIAMVADQSPVGDEKNFWTTFLNQDTAFFIGGERIAKKTMFPVVFTVIRKVKRGYYEVVFEEIADPPYEKSKQGDITQQYAALLEKYIRQEPAYWLWSHMRWKHQRSNIATS